jgi:hypothetical protein
MNGVCNGDLQGCYTFISEFGNSVNDYFIASYDLFASIVKSCSLSVSDNIDSQHLPLELTFTLQNHFHAHIIKVKKKDVLHKFVWNSEHEQQYKDEIKSDVFKQKLRLAGEMIDRNVNEALDLFINAVKDCAVCMKKSITLSDELRKFKWFDRECVLERRRVRKLLRKFRKSLEKVDRDEYCKARREYKNFVHRKKGTV